MTISRSMLFRFVGLLGCGVCLVGWSSVVFARDSTDHRSYEQRRCEADGYTYSNGWCEDDDGNPVVYEPESSSNRGGGSSSSGGSIYSAGEDRTAPSGSDYGPGRNTGGSGESEDADDTDGDGDGEPCQDTTTSTETQTGAGIIVLEGFFMRKGGTITVASGGGLEGYVSAESAATIEKLAGDVAKNGGKIVVDLPEWQKYSSALLEVRLDSGLLVKVVKGASVAVGAVLIAGESSDANAGESDADLYPYRKQSVFDSLSDDDSECTQAEANGEERVSTGSTSSSTSTGSSSSTSSSPVGDSRSGATTRQNR